MLNSLFFAAALSTPADLKNQPITPAASGFLSDLLLVLGLGGALACALFLIVYLARKDRKGRTSILGVPGRTTLFAAAIVQSYIGIGKFVHLADATIERI